MSQSTSPEFATSVVTLDGGLLSSAQIVALGTRRATAVVSDEGRARARDSHIYAIEESSRRALYGRSTGVGANRTVAVDDSEGQAARLLASHATSAGPVRSEPRTRATLAVRINQLAAGGSGARPELLDALLEMLHSDTLPTIREYGSIGTADLSALATIGLAIPIRLEIHDVLPLLSSNAAAIADAAIAQHQLSGLAYAALDVAAATFDVIAGNTEAYSVAAQLATPFEGARLASEAMLSRIAGLPPARIQDPYGVRAIPQVHGAFLDSLSALEQVVARFASAPAENPALISTAGTAHHAGFHAVYLAQALDSAVSAAAQAAQLSLARLALLTEPGYTTLPPFLSDGEPGASGVMICEYVAASALAAIRALSTPAAVQSVNLSRGAEEDASFASLAARQALDSVEPYRVLTACEAIAAVRALRMLGREVPSKFSALPDDYADRDLTPDIALAETLLGG